MASQDILKPSTYPDFNSPYTISNPYTTTVAIPARTHSVTYPPGSPTIVNIKQGRKNSKQLNLPTTPTSGSHSSYTPPAIQATPFYPALDPSLLSPKAMPPPQITQSLPQTQPQNQMNQGIGYPQMYPQQPSYRPTYLPAASSQPMYRPTYPPANPSPTNQEKSPLTVTLNMANIYNPTLNTSSNYGMPAVGQGIGYPTQQANNFAAQPAEGNQYYKPDTIPESFPATSIF